MDENQPASGPVSQAWSKPQDLSGVDLPDLTPATTPAAATRPPVPVPATAAAPPVPPPAARARQVVRTPLPTQPAPLTARIVPVPPVGAPPTARPTPLPVDLTPLPGSLATPIGLPLVPAVPVAAVPAPIPVPATEDDGWDDPALAGGTYKSDTVVRGVGPPVAVPRDDGPRVSTAGITANPDIGLQDPNWVAAQPATGPISRRYEFIDPERKDSGNHGDGREALARMDAREAERRETLAATQRRAAAARSEEERQAVERARERQRREVEEYQRRQRELEQALHVALGTVEQAMRDAADAFLALSICPDHVEFLQGSGVPTDPWRYITWQGRVHTFDELAAIRDDGGVPRYLAAEAGGDAPPVFYSVRERRWGLDRPLAPDAELVVVERALPVVRRHEGGSVRFSATQAGMVLMEEGLVNAYVAGPRVMLWSHLAAARHAHTVHSRITHRLAAGLGLVPKQVAGAAGAAGDAAGRLARSVSEGAVVDAAGTVIDGISSGVAKVEDAVKGLTRLFRRRDPPG